MVKGQKERKRSPIDYWASTTVLKIICAVSSGCKGRKEMEDLAVYRGNKNSAQQYLNPATLSKYLSQKERNMIKESFLIIENAREGLNYKTRKTNSKEPYIYGVNYELILKKFQEIFNQRIIKAITSIETSKETLQNSVKNLNKNKTFYNNKFNQNKNNSDTYIKEDIRDKIIYIETQFQVYQHSIEKLGVLLKELQLHSREEFNKIDKEIIIAHIRTVFYNYHLSCREDRSLNHLLEVSQNQIAERNQIKTIPSRLLTKNMHHLAYVLFDCNKGILSTIKKRINAIKEFENLEFVYE